jgi:hypothetical protein
MVTDVQRVDWLIRSVVAYRNIFLVDVNTDEAHIQFTYMDSILNQMLILKESLRGKETKAVEESKKEIETDINKQG